MILTIVIERTKVMFQETQVIGSNAKILILFLLFLVSGKLFRFVQRCVQTCFEVTNTAGALSFFRKRRNKLAIKRLPQE